MKEFKQGDKVHYLPFEGCSRTLIQNGIVKRKSDEENYFVVYNWSNEPENFMNYTGARTHINQLGFGWVN